MKFRQVHLDFHTSEKIPEIGEKFSKEQFQKALKLGHVGLHHCLFQMPSRLGLSSIYGK